MCCSLDGMGRLLWWLVPSLLTVKAAPDFVLTLNQCLLYLLSPLKFLCSEWSLNYCYGYLPDPRQKWTFCNPLWFVLVSKETIRDSVYKLLMTALCVICIPFSVFSNLKFIPSLHLHWKSQSAWPRGSPFLCTYMGLVGARSWCFLWEQDLTSMQCSGSGKLSPRAPAGHTSKVQKTKEQLPSHGAAWYP